MNLFQYHWSLKSQLALRYAEGIPHQEDPLPTSELPLQPTMMNFTLDLSPLADLDVARFEQICRRNPDLHLELGPKGELVIMAPAGGETGGRNSLLISQLVVWSREHGGKTFDSATGFLLSNGAVRAPDAAWVTSERWQALSPEERRRFPPMCPDLVVELRSPSDFLPGLRAKMVEYLDCGARLGWLLDPEEQAVEIYRPGQPVERLAQPARLSGEDVLPGLVLELDEILYES